MIIFPAVDIQGGKAVRLRQGRKEDVTVFKDDPLEAALRWQKEGAEFLHLVDLDAAFGDLPNYGIIEKIVQFVEIPVQVGGGIRNREIARRYLDAGINRLIIGTMALEDPDSFSELCESYPGRIGVSLDAYNGKLKSRGWLSDADISIRDIVPELESRGSAFIIYTDIERDGTRRGVNLKSIQELVDLARVPVIIAGGVSNLDDIKAIYDLDKGKKIEGVISGRALYENTLNLPDAMTWLKNR